MKAGRIAVFILFAALCSYGQNTPVRLKHFVAPAYPRVAKVANMQGKSIYQLVIGMDGKVKSVEVVSAHAVFAEYSMAALKQWEFERLDKEERLEVTISFELVSDKHECSPLGERAFTPETTVVAELPDKVFVRTGSRCVVVSTS